MKLANEKHRAYLGLSYDQICQLQGRHRNQAMSLWQWASPRFSSLGTDQDRYFKRYGAAATYKRINRVRAWLGLDILD